MEHFSIRLRIQDINVIGINLAGKNGTAPTEHCQKCISKIGNCRFDLQEMLQIRILKHFDVLKFVPKAPIINMIQIDRLLHGISLAYPDSLGGATTNKIVSFVVGPPKEPRQVHLLLQTRFSG